MRVVLLLFVLLLLAVFLQAVELRRFTTTEYEISSAKVKNPIKFVVLADLHGFSYGKGNGRLLNAVRRAAPDVILIAGDLIVTNRTEEFPRLIALCAALAKIAPVFFTNGNHETRANFNLPEEFAAFQAGLKDAGVTLLNNAFSTEPVGETELYLYGLELPLTVYQKRKRNVLPEHCIKDALGPCPEEHFTVLIAHNPAFGDDYFDWGADLTVSGHTHGGLVRLPHGRSFISPELTLFPQYDGGHYEKNGRHLIVSKGLGTHSFHIRIFDRAELVSVRIKPQL